MEEEKESLKNLAFFICWLCSFQKKEEVKNVKLMITNDARRTAYHDGRRPIAIGHLCDSCDPKNLSKIMMCTCVYENISASINKVILQPILSECVVV